jgi:hypothetical protein
LIPGYTVQINEEVIEHGTCHKVLLLIK